MSVENLTRDEAQARAALLDVERYEIHLDLVTAPEEPRLFTSTSTVSFTCREPGASTHLDLTADHVVSASLNGAELDVATAFTGTRLLLTDLAANNTLTVTAACVYSRTGEGLHRFVDPADKEVYLYSQFETFDAHRMYGCFDQPDLKASFAFTVDAPERWTVLSNMPGEHDGERWTFAPTPLQSTYVTAICAGRWHEVRDSHDGIPLGVYCRASLAEHLDPEEILTITRQGFDRYQQLFELRYPWPKYDQVFVPEFNMGAMENPGCVTFTDTYVFRSRVTDATRERRAVTILHEMAHMWFGDLVTMRWWDDLWLNESFAEFVSQEATAESTRWPEAWTTFITIEKTWAYRQDQLSTTHPIAADVPDIEATVSNFDGITYAKGASVLKQLAHWVGRDAFYAGVRAYFAKHSWSNTALSDLLDELSAASGRDLQTWARQWLQTSGVTTLSPELSVDDDGRFTGVAIRQTSNGDALPPHRLRVGLYDLADGTVTRRRQVELDIAGELTEVQDLVGEPQPDLLLLNDDDLAYAKIRFDDRSWRTLVEHLEGLPESLPRALSWYAAWDMTRDGEVSAGDYLDMVLTSIHRETDISLVQSLLRLARDAVVHYGSPQLRDERMARFADRCFALLDGAEPGSDLQLAYARAATGSAVSDAQLDRVARLRDGTESVPGLVMDVDLRWLMLVRLVAMGRAGDAEIDAAVAEDDTATGRRHALQARAACPTAEAKAQAWHDIVETDSLPNLDQGAVIAGFSTPEHRELLAPYVERYFDDVGTLYRERSAEMVQVLVAGLYPLATADAALVTRTEDYLREQDPGAALRRMLQEGRDTAARMLRARDRDTAPVGAG